MGDVILKDEVFAIQGAFFEVSREMGTGFLEAVYQECLEREFAQRAIPHKRHPKLTLVYKGVAISPTYTPDFICFEQIIIELKVAQTITDAHRAQVINYLRATNLKLGLIVNYGVYPKAQVERIAL